jgi:hypothetical protein
VPLSSKASINRGSVAELAFPRGPQSAYNECVDSSLLFMSAIGSGLTRDLIEKAIYPLPGFDY